MFRPLDFFGLAGIEQILTDRIEIIILGWAAIAALYLVLPWFWKLLRGHHG